jgi:hypothetical protein
MAKKKVTEESVVNEMAVIQMITSTQKKMAKIYARRIHDGVITLDDVKPQTEEYRKYVAQVYFELFGEVL